MTTTKKHRSTRVKNVLTVKRNVLDLIDAQRLVKHEKWFQPDDELFVAGTIISLTPHLNRIATGLKALVKAVNRQTAVLEKFHPTS